jgi:nitrogen fixation-related uncharacterized protein
MQLSALAAPLSLSSRLLRSRGRVNWRLAAAILGVALAQAAAVALASWWDGTWFLSDKGKGLFQHYGAWAILITDPLLLIASGFLDRQFCVAMLTLPLSPGNCAKAKLTRILRPHISLVRGKRHTALLYAFLVVVGLFWWAQNVWQTYDPQGPHHHRIFDHHDVFDSGAHAWSFMTFKACLFLSWVVVYPIVGFKFLTIAWSTRAILKAAERDCLVLPRAVHPDGCYGLKNVGTLNIAILAPYLLVFAAMYALWVTHGVIYESLFISWATVTIIFIATSFVVIWPAQLMLWRARDKEYQELLRSGRPPPESADDLFQFAAKRFFFFASNASPYSDGTKVVILAMRASPIFPFLLKAFH